MQSKRVWLSLFVSYFLILLIPILIFLGVYLQIYGTVSRQIIQSNASMLDQIRLELDNELTEMNGFVVKASLDPNLSFLMGIPSESRLYQSYDSMRRLLTLNQSLAMYMPGTSVIENYAIYCRNSCLAYYNSNVYDPDLFFGANVARSCIAPGAWERCISMRLKRRTVVRYELGDAPLTRSMVAVLEPLPLDSTDSRGFLMSVLNGEKIRQRIRALSRLNGSRVYIVDETGAVLFATDLGAPPPAPLPDAEHIRQDRNAVTYQAASSVYPWRYVNVIPVSVFWEKSRSMTLTMLAGFLLSLAAGALLIRQLARRNYRPVRDLVAVASRRTGVPVQPSLDEYQFIKKSFLDVYRENDSMSTRIRQQEEAIRRNFLHRLLKGRVGPSDCSGDILESLGIHFLSDRFAVVLCALLPDPQDGRSDGASAASPTMAEFDSWMTGALRARLHENYEFFGAEADDFLAYIVAVPEEEAQDWRATLGAVLSSVRAEPLRAGWKPSFAVSRLENSIPAIPHGFQDAMRSMEYRLFGGGTGVMFTDEVLAQERNANQYRYTMEEEQIILNAIRTGDFEKAREMVDRVLDDNLPEAGAPIGKFKCLIYDLIGTFIKSLNQEHGMDELKFPDMDATLNRIVAKPTAAETRQELLSCLRTICERMADYGRDNERLSLVRRVERFIEEEYLDRNLGVAAISAAIGMNPKYLSSIYRAMKGESMVDTLHKRRLREIKRLLRENGTRIGDAASRSGYSSVATLMRAFKKYEGITPGRFKGFEE